MKILFHHLGIVPVKHYGGTERILVWLMKELVQLGHEVCLIAHPECEVSNIGVELIPYSDETKDDWRSLIPNDIDIMHLFNTPRHIDLSNFPMLITIHGNGQIGEEFFNNTVFVSKSHANNHGSNCFVHNGIDFSEYPYQGRKRESEKLLFLAKASWKVKNLKDCKRAVKSAKKELHIAGGKTWSFYSKFYSYGLVDQIKKNELFYQCDALLAPVRWHEPFGMQIIEAMGAGLPVFTSNFGAFPELINERVGRLCSSYNEFAEIIQSDFGRLFDNDEIAEYARSTFNSLEMAKKYVEYYKLVLSNTVINVNKPKAQFSQAPQDLLPF